MANSLVSVIIPVHHGGEAFLRCLRGLAAAVPPPDELIVVADGETDGTWRAATAYDALILRNEVAQGPACARNQGARIARGDVLCFIDADVVVAPDVFARIRETLAQEPDVMALIGSYDDAPSDLGFVSQYRNLLHHFTHQTAEEEAGTFWGACGAVRRDAFWDVDGFDEQYRQPSIEDIELGYRLKQAGHRLRLCKDMQVKHLKRWKVGSMLRTDFLHRALPWTELILRRRHFPNDLNLRKASRWSVALVNVLLTSFVAALCAWPLFFVSAGAAIGLGLLNAPLYEFFHRKRGLAFALLAVPLHWFYYFYSGLAFAIGLFRYRRASSPAFSHRVASSRSFIEAA